MNETPHWALLLLELSLAAGLLSGCAGTEGVYRGVYDGARTVERERAVERGDRPSEWDPTYDEYERFRKRKEAGGTPSDREQPTAPR